MYELAALRGVATLKARAGKEAWNMASVKPVEKAVCAKLASSLSGELWIDNSPVFFNQQVLAAGTELLKRTRKGSVHISQPYSRKKRKKNDLNATLFSYAGDLHWKVVSVYIHRTGQVSVDGKIKIVIKDCIFCLVFSLSLFIYR